MNGELLLVLEHIERDKRITRKVLIEAIESSLISASKKRLGKEQDVTVKINPETGEIKVFAILEVVKKVEEKHKEILLVDAKRIDSGAKIGDFVNKEITPANFGRIAAQTAKQVIIQKIREAEREIVFSEYKDRVGDIVNGVIRRVERGNIIIDLGRTEAVLPYKEQSPNENYPIGSRMGFYILDVRDMSRGPDVILSRSHPGLVHRLFEIEVPEIAEGTVEVKAVAREPGYRSKIAVISTLEKVDPVGACVGLRGERVKTIVGELSGEKIDIVRYSANVSTFVENSLSPAEVSSIKIDEKNKSMQITVRADQFSLAIGKKGQNARLTSKLVGWRIDIKKQSEDLILPKKDSLIDGIPGVSAKINKALVDAGYNTMEAFESLDIDKLKSIKGVGEKTALKIMDCVTEHIRKENSKTKLDEIIAAKSANLER